MTPRLHFLTCCLCLAAAAFVNSWQEDPFLPGVAERVKTLSDRITMQKADNLAFDYAAHYPPGSHTAKLNYRLIPPLIARLIGCDGLRLVELAAWLTLGACIYVALARVSSFAGAGTLALLCTSSGAVYHNDLGHCCDVLAQALLSLCLVWSSPWLLAGCTLLALFTDERACLILPLVYLMNGRKGAPIFAALLVYGGARLALGHWLYGPTSYSDVACLDYALAGLRLMPAVMWGCLEGGWLLLLVSCFLIWRRGSRMLACGLLLYPLAVCCLSLAVLDLTRSASYALLVVPVAVMLAGRVDRWLLVVAAAISVLCPNSQFITGFIESFK